ncbi:hephaestin-like protein [Acanthaster planci]|uniref:Hephaestin-like protein n=1 Tax=Acanthaster planci TaxID=133434 RepID=A0A8B7ZCN2_ACAPL|nr:hephaestin-like protein [Acanthaster planci]
MQRLHTIRAVIAGLLLIVSGVIVSAQGGLGNNQLREYFVAAVEIEWDYAPSGRNLIKDTDIQQGSYEADFLLNGTYRIGRKYKKAVYKQYTDDTYTQEIPKPEWLGFLGPLLYAEVGDTIFVHFKNMASRPYTVHPHGMKYEKDSEGAVYEDKTSGKDKADENIKPGGEHRFKWKATQAAGPADNDENCRPWPYHTHISTPEGTNTGLIGALVICKEGILDEQGRRKDVDKEFLLMFAIMDENLSYLLNENVETYIGRTDFDQESDDFIRSNKMDGINGYLYGNLPGLEVCVGDKVDWHIMAFGTEADIHTIYFHGNLLTFQRRRRDSLSLSPAVLMSAMMEAKNPGTWLVTSASTTHFKDGAQALYTVSESCGTPGEAEMPSGQREYFIAAEEIEWDYAPNRTHSDGTSFNDSSSHSYPFFTKEDNRIGGKYRKAKFVGYTDNTFTIQSYAEPHLGILGPVIRGEVGDVIRVTLRNSLTNQNISLQPHGVRYNKSNEGQAYNDGTSGADHFDETVIPESSYTYTWTIPEYVGPTNIDQDCITWIYTSAVDPEGDVFAGLVGPLLVCKKGSLNTTTGKQLRVDQEFFLLFTTFDENLSWLIDQNIATYSANPGAVDKNDEVFVTSNQMASINGYSYNNLVGITMTVGDRVSWHVMAVGKYSDEHTVAFESQVVTHNSVRKVAVPVFPGVSETVIMDADVVGRFHIECETNSHLVKGMEGSFTVTPKENAVSPDVGNAVRTFYIGIVERYWDFVPVKYDPIRSQNLTDPESPGYVFVNQGETSIGSRYKKALFREFTDESFKVEKNRTGTDAHLGVQGPLLHMEVGETVEVVLKNMASRRYALEPHGVLVVEDSMDSEGGVQAGGNKTYRWKVPERAGPTAADPNCVVYAYYSNIDKERDTNSGLVGPMVVCRPDTLGEDGRRRDVDQEFVLLFTVMDENKSWYLDENIAKFCSMPNLVDKEDAGFQESNLMHGINGLLYHNLRNLEMSKDDTVEWYLIGLGDEVDVHSVHFHGQTITYRTAMVNRIDVFELFAGVYGSVQMHADNPGSWLLHCHVNDHILGGMETSYTVIGVTTEKPQPQPTTPASACCIASTLLIVITGFIMAWKFN